MTSINYTLRYSKKAKYLQLRISHKGVEVIIPEKKRVSKHHIDDFILQKSDWILRTKQRYALHNVSLQKPALPTYIHLPAINQAWNISYIATSHRHVSIYANSAGQIKIMGNIADENACTKLLKKWLKQTAEQYLCEMLRRVSNEVGLPFNQVSIRNNTTRWGSCSSKKNISLCCRLLFLPDYLIRHILLHELCHTKVMNHGRLFWSLLKKLDVNTNKHVKELKTAASLVPAWII